MDTIFRRNYYFKQFGIVLLLFFLSSITSFANSISKTHLCPICKIEFSAINTSRNEDDSVFLDGVRAKKSLPILPECPLCQGVFPENYQYSKSELKKLKKILWTRKYKNINSGNRYFRFATILNSISDDSYRIAKAYLSAFVSMPKSNKNKYICLDKAISFYKNYVYKNQSDSKRKTSALFLIGELLRQKGKFADAKKQFVAIRKRPEFTGVYYSKAIDAEFELINNKKSNRMKFLSDLPIHNAIKKNDIEQLKKCLLDNRDLNEFNAKGETPLILALKMKNAEAVKCLLESGANPNLKDLSGCSPLVQASAWGNSEILSQLLKSGGKLDNSGNVLNSPLQTAIVNGKEQAAIKLIDSGDKLNILDSNGNNLLHLLAKSELSNSENILKRLISSRVEINGRNYDSETPLHLFVKSANVRQIGLLIDAGAKINAKLPNGKTPLFLSRPKLVKYLIENGADINTEDNAGLTAFEEACVNNNLLKIEAFKKTGLFGASPEKIKTSYGVMSIFQAITRNNIFALKEIVNADKNLVNSKNLVLGESPLHFAVLAHNMQIVKYLLLNQANVNSKNDYRRTPLHYAAMECSIDLCKLLIKAGANMYAVDLRGNTPMHEAARFGRKDIYNFLVESGASYETKNNRGISPEMLLEKSQ